MKFSKTFNSGIFIAIVGVVLFSAKAVMVKLGYKFQVSSLHFLLFRMLFAVPFYVLIAIFFKPKFPNKIRGKDYFWVLCFGFIGYYLASLFDFIGLQYISAGLERIILFIYPTLVVLISWIFLKEKLTRKQGLAILMTYIGVVITFWSEIKFGSSKAIVGGFLIILSALTYASYLVGSGWLIPKFGVIPFTAYAMIVSSICVIIHYLIVDRNELLNYPNEVYVLGFLMAVFATVIPSFLVSLAIKKMGASNFSIVGSIGPVATIVMAYFFLDERLSFLQILGSAVVILGVFVVSRTKMTSKL